MINNIKIKSTDPFDSTTKTISFGRVNVIIGPKGGGKSTLYDLVANLESNQIFSSVIDAMKDHKIELVSYTLNGEEYPSNNATILSVPKKAEAFKNSHYDTKYNVIYQDDPIKKNLSESSALDKEKMDFAKKVVNESEDVINVINLIRKLYESIHKTTLYDNQNINWSKIAEIANLGKVNEQLIFDLNYSPRELKANIIDATNILVSQTKDIEMQISGYKNEILRIEQSANSIFSLTYNDSKIKNIKELILILENLKTLNDAELKRINKIKKTISSFEISFTNKVAALKKMREGGNAVVAFKTQSSEHFRQMAINLKQTRNAFNNFMNHEVVLNINVVMPTENLLELAINETIELDQDKKLDLLKTVLHNAKNTTSLVENWIKSSQDGNKKPFEDIKLVNAISKYAKDKIKVMANGKDYDTLSLGQKSIYGITYKFNKSVDKPIFLDQPEDNLDNYTIAKEVVELIKNKEQQTFIVTHNANIGLLTKPDCVIVAKFTDIPEDQTVEQYQIGTVKEDAIKQSDSAHYLEGGTEYITERLNIIKGVE